MSRPSARPRGYDDVEFIRLLPGTQRPCQTGGLTGASSIDCGSHRVVLSRGSLKSWKGAIASTSAPWPASCFSFRFFRSDLRLGVLQRWDVCPPPRAETATEVCCHCCSLRGQATRRQGPTLRFVFIRSITSHRMGYRLKQVLDFQPPARLRIELQQWRPACLHAAHAGFRRSHYPQAGTRVAMRGPCESL